MVVIGGNGIFAMKRFILSYLLVGIAAASLSEAAPLDYSVSWVGNSFPGARDKWVQNFFIHTKVQPDGTVNTWSHWDEGGKKFGVYKDGDVVGNQDVQANSLEVADQAGRRWKLVVDYTDPTHNEWDFVPREIECDGKAVTFPELEQPTARARGGAPQRCSRATRHVWCNI